MRTGQSAQMRLASREEPPFSGKKTSGSYSRHLALSCQGMKWCIALSPQNYSGVILKEEGAVWQEESFPSGDFPHTSENRDGLCARVQGVLAKKLLVNQVDHCRQPS